MHLKMKDLEARTGLSRQAIHFYLREGLLPEPERPKRNVANYSEDHVARIKLIKRLQEERFLPLGVIKNMLADADQNTMPSAGMAAFQLTTLSLMNGDVPAPDQLLEDVVARTGISEKDMEQLHKRGVIEITEAEGLRYLDFRDAAIVEQWQHLLDLGFRGVPGYDAAYLQRYADALKLIAETEVDLFLQQFGDAPAEQTAELAVRGIEVTNDIVARLRTQALLRRLNEQVATETVN